MLSYCLCDDNKITGSKTDTNFKDKISPFKSNKSVYKTAISDIVVIMIIIRLIVIRLVKRCQCFLRHCGITL